MPLNTLRDLYVHELMDLYSAEKQMIETLPEHYETAGYGTARAHVRSLERRVESRTSEETT